MTEAAVNGGVLSGDTADRYREYFLPIEDVFHVLEHDGYLAKQRDGHRFVSGLLEDWWRTRYGGRFVSIVER